MALYLHGTASSRLEIALYADSAQRHGERFLVPLHVLARRNDPFRSLALRLSRAGAELHWFNGGHICGFAPPVADPVKALMVRS